jgi:hypothetical protein
MITLTLTTFNCDNSILKYPMKVSFVLENVVTIWLCRLAESEKIIALKKGCIAKYCVQKFQA